MNSGDKSCNFERGEVRALMKSSRYTLFTLYSNMKRVFCGSSFEVNALMQDVPEYWYI